jgi:hypothetical protein
MDFAVYDAHARQVVNAPFASKADAEGFIERSKAEHARSDSRSPDLHVISVPRPALVPVNEQTAENLEHAAEQEARSRNEKRALLAEQEAADAALGA